MPLSLTGSVVVVVGATGGLGSRIALQLVDHGADVRLIVRDPLNVAPSLRHLPTAVADVRSRNSLEAAIQELDARGQLFGIVNATGVVAFGATTEVGDDVARELVAVNTLGCMNVLAIAGTMVQSGGFVVSLSGVAADMTVMSMGAYCASKAGAKAAMAVAAREFRPLKVRVLDVRAPHTETGLMDRAIAGAPPRMPAGANPDAVAARIVLGIVNEERDLPVEAFA